MTERLYHCVYVVILTAPDEPADEMQALLAVCETWSRTKGRSQEGVADAVGLFAASSTVGTPYQRLRCSAHLYCTSSTWTALLFVTVQRRKPRVACSRCSDASRTR